MGLGDGTWANVTIVQLAHVHGSTYGIVLSTTLMALGVIAASLIVVRWSTNPLQRLAEAARKFHGAESGMLLEENGPQEVQDAAVAFNEMQQRIKTLIQDRTLGLAAISHDLKTPLTRVRFRVEDIVDQGLRDRIVGDVEEMEDMIDSTLAFLRGEKSPEHLRQLELRALLESICSDLSDRGFDARLTDSGRAVIWGRPSDLKRAFSNLIQNAIKYGDVARITLREGTTFVDVMIEDEGAGIPPDQFAAVIAPFYRIETSRSRETGGVGLGLTVAHRIIMAHEGTLALENRQPRGLRATVRLPLGNGQDRSSTSSSV